MKSKMEKLYDEDLGVELPEDVFILCEEVVKIYMSDGLKVMALQGLDLCVKRGEMVAVIGKSGSGKSTLMNMIGGLETPTTGRIWVAGREISTLKEKEMVNYRKNTVGFVWQNSARNLFFYMTVLENITTNMRGDISNKQKRERAMELLELVGMKEQAKKYPSQLSGGQQQRVAIAVALACDPELLLADEPTGAVDSKTSAQILELFGRLNRELGLTIVIVTHDMKLAGAVPRVVMISDGKVSTEKLQVDMSSYEGAEFSAEEIIPKEQEEFSVLDKANRLQLTDEMLEISGISGNRVKVHTAPGEIVIRQGKKQ